MNMLQRKLIRDLTASKWLFLAVAVVIFLGVALFESSFLGYRNLKTSYEFTYDQLAFADFTVKVVEAPWETVAELESLPGVQAVTGRVNTDIPLTLTGDTPKTILVRAISLPANSRPAVNNVKVEEGDYFDQSDGDVLLMDKSFAEHHDLQPQDAVYLAADEGDSPYQIKGIVTSPEYIWPAKSRQEILVSSETFGVVFVSHDTAANLTGKDTINEFSFLVEEGADRDSVIDAVKDALGSHDYQIMDVVTLEDQPSNAALQLDLQQFSEMAEVFPALFLIVGALATYILLTMLVQNQRSQIGLMRAVGYTRRQVLVHYLSFALAIGVVGAVAGTVAGYLLSEVVTQFYGGILGLPYTSTKMGWLEWMALGEGMTAGILPCVIAGIVPAWSASRLPPSEAMRTPSPTAGRRLLLERLFPFLTRLSSLWKIPLRNIFRSRRRSLYTIIGVAFGISLILVSAAFIDSFEHVFDLQFNRIQKSDAQINFARPQPYDVVEGVQNWSEVERAEPILQIPTQMVHSDRTYATMVVGLPAGSELYGLLSPDGEQVDVARNGILLSSTLRDTLDIEKGDTLFLLSEHSIEHGIGQLEVAGFVMQTLGSFGYVSLQQAQELAGGERVVSGIMLSVDPEHVDGLREKARSIPGTPSVVLTAETTGQINDMMGLIRGMMWVMLGFGALLSLAIVFTIVTVSIMERRREIATMRTLGETKGRIAAMITIENIVLGLAGIIVGIPLGYYLAMSLMSLVQTDMMDFSLAIFPRTYALTVGLIILIVLIAQVPSLRNLNRMDLAKVIKEQSP
ncbi:MAG: FtsX-like permease family protein [Dehalococcoidia bacterium]